MAKSMLLSLWLKFLFSLISFRVVDGVFNLTILHTNDVHARFEEFNKYGSQCSDDDAIAGKCFGGVARRFTKVKEIREKFPNVLFLDGGDQYQGTIWFVNYNGKAASYFMNNLTYDAMTLGNHEFDAGVQGLVPFLESVHFPVVSSNIDASLEPTMQGKITKSVVLTVGGEKIGIVGYTTTETPVISMPGKKLKFLDEIDSVRAEVVALQNQGVDKIIALGHAGFRLDKELALNVDGVDIVVGGHTDTFLYTADEYPYVQVQSTGRKVLVVQDFTYGKYLGFLQVAFDDQGEATSWNGNPILLDSTVQEDPSMLTDVHIWKEPILEKTKEVVGKSHVLLDGRRSTCRMKECNLGNLVADAMLSHNIRDSKSSRWNNVAIAIMNSGGIRNSITEGDVTLGQIITVLPFRNTLDIVELRGNHLLAVLENSVAEYNLEDPPGRFLQFSGIRVVYNLDKPAGYRVIQALVRCADCRVPDYQPIEMYKLYQVVLPNFLAAGGDGYDVIQNHAIRHILLGDLDNDVFSKYLTKHSPIIYGNERRIRFTNQRDDSCFLPLTGSATSNAGYFALSLILYILRVA